MSGRKVRRGAAIGGYPVFKGVAGSYRTSLNNKPKSSDFGLSKNQNCNLYPPASVINRRALAGSGSIFWRRR